MWTTDAIKSIGMVIPLVSLILILRVWRSFDWQTEGTWWGLVLLLITMAAIQIQIHSRATLILVVSPHWTNVLPPPSLVLIAYASGVVLLLGGVRQYRAALFPILFLWFANPIPSNFVLLVDLPLQHAAAHIARAFAMELGCTLTPDRLRLMFTPDFGMFIAPGCNGIRGSVTMGFIALIAGYVYRFRWYANALVVMGAIVLGYVFNFARLCLLVLYYVLALHFPSLQNKAENADYLIGAALFLVATLLLFTVIHRLRDARNPDELQTDTVANQGGFHNRAPHTRYAHLAALGVVVLLGCAGVARAIAVDNPFTAPLADAPTKQFPPRLGNYTLVRTWDETLLTGAVVYVWAQYAPADGGTPISIGISPMLGWHEPIYCHLARAETPVWQGPLTVTTAGVVPISFSSAFYNDGLTQYIEASTICSGRTCGEFAIERTHFGFLYTRPDPKFLPNDDPRRPIPVMLRAETIDMTLSADAARQQLTNNLRAFLASVRLDDLTQPISR